eukprot:SM000016S01972  [mRNA]  locus=s16:903511:904106:- [translate_table: standard]
MPTYADDTTLVGQPAGGLTLLGVPLGSPAFVDDQLRGKLQEHLKPAARLPELHDMQLALAMLTRSIAQRPLCVARALPPSPAAQTAYATFDAGVLASTAALVQHPVGKSVLCISLLLASYGLSLAVLCGAAL